MNWMHRKAWLGVFMVFLLAVDAAAAPTGTASTMTSASRPGPLPPARTIDEGLVLQADEQAILAAVRDRSQQLDEQALFVLLRRSAAMPHLTEEQFDSLARIPAGRLLAEPAKFRCEPMRLRLKVFMMKQWTPGREIGTSPYWPADRPVWFLTGFDYTGDTPSQTPLAVLSIVDPSEALGKPERIGQAGESIYLPGRNLDLAGIFYKAWTDMSVGSQKNDEPAVLTEYPVIIAWQIKPTPPLISDEAKLAVGIVLATMAVAASYLYLRRRNRPAGAKQLGIRRVAHAAQPAQAQHGEEENDIDPALKAAVEESQGGSDRNGSTDRKDRTINESSHSP